MSGSPALDSPAKSGLVGVLRSWLHAWWSQTGQAPEVLSTLSRGADARYNGSIRVLIVDDDPVNLMVISALMESRGLVPVQAANGAEAVTLVRELHFDLVLMDLQMPILDGFNATTSIRRFETLSTRPAVPVIAYSSSSPAAGILADHGLNGSLSKPCSDDELEDCLLQWCPTYRHASAARCDTHDHHTPSGTAHRNPGARSASLR